MKHTNLSRRLGDIPVGTVASGVALTLAATLALATPSASAAADTIQVKYSFGDHGNILDVDGTSGSDRIYAETTSSSAAPNALTVSASRPITLSDETGTCVQASTSSVSCPRTLDLMQIRTGDGNDFLSRGGGVDAEDGVGLWMGTGDDTVVVENDFTSSAPCPGSRCGSPRVFVHGEAGNDVLWDNTEGSQETTHFYGGDGNDLSNGANRASGGSGADVLRARLSGSASTLRGGPGADLVRGRLYDDDLRGGPGRDLIRDNGGNNVIYGGHGNDRIETANGGHDDINCGPGKDSVYPDWRDFLYRCEVVFR